jgi:predicted methyltransferase
MRPAIPRFFIEFLDARKIIEDERELKEQILRMLALHEGDSVLDVGCGTGDHAREIAGLVGIRGRVVGGSLGQPIVAFGQTHRPFIRSIADTQDSCSTPEASAFPATVIPAHPI